MTTEEKAKAYDKALEQAQKELAACGNMDCDAARQIFRLFPQLRESENERMMRMIGLALTDVPEERFTSLGTTLKDCLAYLEKQKEHFRDDTKMVEQKSAENGVDVIRTSALLAADRLASAEMTERLKERSEILENPEEYGLYKPAEWSEEDERIMDNCIEYIKASCLDASDLYECIDWLKSLRPQPHKEIYQAAKHDLAIKFMHYLDKNRPEGKMCLYNGECEDIDKAFKEGDWAKIIRYIKKYQPHWKPSEEQMEAMEFVIKDYREDNCIATANYLQEILDQIKKL